MKNTICFAASLLVLLSSTRAIAGPATLAINNYANADVDCAILRWEADTWTTHHWYSIAHGDSLRLTEVEYYRCEEVGGDRYWDGEGDAFACVTRGDNWIDPIYGSDSFEVCDSLLGEMVSFGYVPGSEYSVNLRP